MNLSSYCMTVMTGDPPILPPDGWNLGLFVSFSVAQSGLSEGGMGHLLGRAGVYETPCIRPPQKVVGLAGLSLLRKAPRVRPAAGVAALARECGRTAFEHRQPDLRLLFFMVGLAGLIPRNP